MDEVTFVEQLAEVWPDCATEFIANHCIVAARAAVEIGLYFGVPVAERAVKVLVINRKGYEALENGIGVPDWPDDAWSVGIDSDDSRAPGLSGYPGHVIAETESWILDLSAAQFNRPQRNLIVPGPLVLPRGPDPSKTWAYQDQHGQRICYDPIDDRSYRQSRDWRINWKDAVPAAIRMMKERSRDDRESERQPGTVQPGR